MSMVSSRKPGYVVCGCVCVCVCVSGKNGNKNRDKEETNQIDYTLVQLVSHYMSQ
ncbi:hypothetical protein EXN66_Car012206 [Channa argus]|uniref:Uncharacterized protein n=1 Tax=Channa argus TaxID=215402 RepID=A0A6G1Q2P1_CHAAH|nr:hypothetical protein EXN66_Car012206 [Channa argus]